MSDDGLAPVPKPDELLALGGITAEMFAILRTWFDVPPRVTLDLVDVDSAVTELGDPVMIAALAMRKLQALNLLATPGVRTTTDVVVTIVSDLDPSGEGTKFVQVARFAGDTLILNSPNPANRSEARFVRVR